MKHTRKHQLQDLRKFVTKLLVPFLIFAAIFCYITDRLARDRVIFRTPILGAAKIHRMMHRRSPEIPIIGTSRALGSYIPDSLSLHSYNYGINGIGYDVMDIFVEADCKRYASQLPVIINFDYGMFNHEIGDINNYIPNVHHESVRGLLKRNGHYEFWHDLFGLRFFSSWDTYAKEYINYRVQLTKVTTLGAALEKNKLPQAQFDRLIAKRLATKRKWNPHQDMIDKLFERLESRRDKMYIFAIAPYHRSYYESFAPGAEAQAHLLLDSIEAQPNATVIEVRGDDWPDSLFVNTSHINFDGAIRFTRILREAIYGLQTGEAPKPLLWAEGHVPDWLPAYRDSVMALRPATPPADATIDTTADSLAGKTPPDSLILQR